MRHYLKRALLLACLIFLLISGCPIYNIWGITCPCCGVTRAWLAFLRGNVRLAFQYHALFLFIPFIAIFYLVLDWIPHRWKRCANVSGYILAVAVFVYAILRWLGFVVIP